MIQASKIYITSFKRISVFKINGLPAGLTIPVALDPWINHGTDHGTEHFLSIFLPSGKHTKSY